MNLQNENINIYILIFLCAKFSKILQYLIQIVMLSLNFLCGGMSSAWLRQMSSKKTYLEWNDY